MAKKVCSYCNYCKLKLRKLERLETQQMALIRDEQLQPCPPFTHVALDFMGPLSVCGEVNKRASMKIWVLVYTCRSTRAVCLLACTGYSTDNFILRHKEFTYRHGICASLVSDRGTQLVSAGMVLEEDSHPVNWNWKKIVAANKTTNWTFTEIGCQWRNGLPESMVKSTKKCLEKALTEYVSITYGELVTLLAGITYTINCRPIGVKGSTDLQDEIQPITPNMLLIGRSDNDSKRPSFDQQFSLPKRSAYVKNLLDTWWSLWIKQVWPHLIPCKKWKNEKRNLKVGDICLLYYPGTLAGKFKMVKVVETHPDEKGLVRTVTILMRKKKSKEKPDKLDNKKSLLKERVGVQRLVVIQPVDEQVESHHTGGGDVHPASPKPIPPATHEEHPDAEPHPVHSEHDDQA